MNEINQFMDFLDAAPSSFHAAHAVADRLLASGFQKQVEDQPWDASPGGHVLVRDGAVLAWFVPDDAGPHSGFRIIGSHTDSPGFSLKPQPDSTQHGWQQLGVEIYGGPIIPSWFDRELTLAGQVILTDGSERLVNTGPILRIPHLAIHLDSSKDFSVDKQQHLHPVMGLADAATDAVSAHAQQVGIASIIAGQLGVAESDIASCTLITAPAQPASLFGVNADLLASSRMDNLSSVFASMVALERAVAADDLSSDIAVLAAFDHEEVGSASTTGAQGPILAETLERTATALGADRESYLQMLRRSSCVSADAAHSIHPNYAEKHDPHNPPIIGGGPVTKINSKQRYASNARTIAMWENACRAAMVPIQNYVSKNSVPCGSTIGPATATALGIDTVDVGVPMLSMHSAREMIGIQDQLWLSQALESYLIN